MTMEQASYDWPNQICYRSFYRQVQRPLTYSNVTGGTCILLLLIIGIVKVNSDLENISFTVTRNHNSQHAAELIFDEKYTFR